MAYDEQPSSRLIADTEPIALHNLAKSYATVILFIRQ